MAAGFYNLPLFYAQIAKQLGLDESLLEII